MKSMDDYFNTFLTAFPATTSDDASRLRLAFHAGATAVCALLSQAAPEDHAAIIKELQQEAHVFGKKDL